MKHIYWDSSLFLLLENLRKSLIFQQNRFYKTYQKILLWDKIAGRG